MFKHIQLEAIAQARVFLSLQKGYLEAEVEWTWRNLMECDDPKSPETVETRQGLERKYEKACKDLGELVGTLKELERLSWALNGFLQQGKEQI